MMVTNCDNSTIIYFLYSPPYPKRCDWFINMHSKRRDRKLFKIVPISNAKRNNNISKLLESFHISI